MSPPRQIRDEARLRRRLRAPVIVDRFMAAVPTMRPWIEAGNPISEVKVMGSIENRWRRLVDADDRPVIGGFVLAGDASLHTNPTLGRGVALALAQAQQLAHTVKHAPADPVGYVAGFERWTAEHLGIWFESQIAADRTRMTHVAAGIRGDHLPPPSDPINRFIAGMFALAATDDLVARALARIGHLLLSPAELFRNTTVVGHVRDYLAENPVIEPFIDGPDRDELQRLVMA